MKWIMYSVVGLVCALIPTVETIAQTPEKPHPWCRSLTGIILDDDPTSRILAQSFFNRLNANFDIKGYDIVKKEQFENIVKGIQENEIDFAIVPFNENQPLANMYLNVEAKLTSKQFRKFMADNRIFVLGDCCKKDDKENDATEIMRSKMDIPLEYKGYEMNYKIIASPRIFEMGYKHRNLIYRTANESVRQFVGELGIR